MKKRQWIAGTLSGLLLTAMLTGCGAGEAGTAQPTGADAVPTLPADVQVAPPAETEGLPYVQVSTPYGDLYYQDQWEEYMVTEQEDTGDGVKVTFSACINGMTYPLFYVTIGSGEGALVGELTGPDGAKREVYVRSNEMEEISELSDSERNRLYAMQEDINYIIENLK